LDAECNPGIPNTSYQHMNACNYARLGLAVWRVKPEAYEAFDHFMFQTNYPPSLQEARAAANKLVGQEEMAKVLKDPRLEDLVRTGVSIFHSGALQRRVLPILITSEEVEYGIPDHPELTAMFAGK
jgi:hypothetical protein